MVEHIDTCVGTQQHLLKVQPMINKTQIVYETCLGLVFACFCLSYVLGLFGFCLS